ncbi:hypothetical protein AHF37_00213 [Paragonimus kellicotti]|nr:hypothetical protein AHF37_00213 [Paragonimus kellicotti]
MTTVFIPMRHCDHKLFSEFELKKLASDEHELLPSYSPPELFLKAYVVTVPRTWNAVEKRHRLNEQTVLKKFKTFPVGSLKFCVGGLKHPLEQSLRTPVLLRPSYFSFVTVVGTLTWD